MLGVYGEEGGAGVNFVVAASGSNYWPGAACILEARVPPFAVLVLHMFPERHLRLKSLCLYSSTNCNLVDYPSPNSRCGRTKVRRTRYLALEHGTNPFSP